MFLKISILTIDESNFMKVERKESAIVNITL